MSRVNNTIDKFGRHKVNGKVQLLRGLPGVGFRLTPNDQYDILGKSLTNVANPTNNNDATTKEYVLSEIQKIRFQLTEFINKDIIDYIDKVIESLEKKIINFDLIIERDVYRRAERNEARISSLEKKVNNLIVASKIRI